jgi:hypothetical protein
MPTSIPTLAAMATPVITALTRNANMTSLLVFKFGSAGSNPNRSMPNGNARPAPFVTLVLTMAYVRTPGRIFGVRRNFGLPPSSNGAVRRDRRLTAEESARREVKEQTLGRTLFVGGIRFRRARQEK